MEEKWIEASKLPADEKVYLKKDFLGWRVVEPIFKEDPWHKKLFGSNRNKLFSAVIIILALLFYLGVNELISQYKDIAENPCNYCSTAIKTNDANGIKLNYSEVNLSLIKTNG